MNAALATPEAFVCTVMVLVPLPKTPEAPLAGAVKTTLVPTIGLNKLSVTVTASGVVKAVLTAALCGVVPLLAVMAPGAPAALVRIKETVAEPAEAFTLYVPVLVLGIKVAAATPDELVWSVTVFVPLVKVPDVPVAGAVNTTVAPLIRLPPASVTVTVNGFAKAVPTTVVCGVVPAFAEMTAGGPTVLVKENEVERVPAMAVTL